MKIDTKWEFNIFFFLLTSIPKSNFLCSLRNHFDLFLLTPTEFVSMWHKCDPNCFVLMSIYLRCYTICVNDRKKHKCWDFVIKISIWSELFNSFNPNFEFKNIFATKTLQNMTWCPSIFKMFGPLFSISFLYRHILFWPTSLG